MPKQWRIQFRHLGDNDLRIDGVSENVYPNLMEAISVLMKWHPDMQKKCWVVAA